jgi:DNA-binding XRE family transcriptional regulator
MRLDTLINTETKNSLLKLSFSLKRSNTDRQRALVKGDYYADEITKIRHLSKRKLVKFIEQKRIQPSIKLGLKIAHSSSPRMYRMLDSKVKCDIELINYARNRLYASS